MIDVLHGRIDQRRTANQRLEEVAEHLVEIIRSEWRLAQESFLAPQLDAARR